MGYKGWISSTNKSGTTVFAFKAEEGKTFDSFTFTYSGYSIAVEETDIYDIYVSTTAEDWSDPALVYNEKDWTLVSALRNDDKLAGTGVYPKDPTNRDAALRRSVDLSSFAKGKDTVYVRVDSYRSTNIDGLPTVFGGAYAVTAEYTAAETTAIPMTTAASTTTGGSRDHRNAYHHCSSRDYRSSRTDSRNRRYHDDPAGLRSTCSRCSLLSAQKGRKR